MSISNFTSEKSATKRLTNEVRESVCVSQETDTDLLSIISASLLFVSFLCHVFWLPSTESG